MLERRRAAAWCVVAALVALAAACWIWVQAAGAFPGDEALRPWMEDQDLPWPARVVVVAYDAVGFPAIAVVTVATLAWLVSRRIGVRYAALVVAAAAVPALTTALKWILGPAPLQRALVGDHPAFPSGHTAYAASLFGLLAWLALSRGRRDLAAAALVVVVGMGPARIAQGAHWPSDVIGGYALGFAWLLAVLLVGLPSARR